GDPGPRGAPHVGKVGAREHEVPGREARDVVADEALSLPPVHQGELVLGVVVPEDAEARLPLDAVDERRGGRRQQLLDPRSNRHPPIVPAREQVHARSSARASAPRRAVSYPRMLGSSGGRATSFTDPAAASRAGPSSFSPAPIATPPPTAIRSGARIVMRLRRPWPRSRPTSIHSASVR